MRAMQAILGYPLGWIMYAMYNIFHNYGVALIVFTVLTKLIMVPMSIKQQKGMAKMAAFQPQVVEIQTKYKSNPTKMQEEMAILYQRENYNPMSGCLPMLIQFPILFGLIDVIYNPLKHILRFSKEVIAAATPIATDLLTAAGDKINPYSIEMGIVKAVDMNPGAFSSLGGDFVEKVRAFDFTFLGIDLGATPEWAWNILLLIPILSLVTSVLVSMISMKTSTAATGEANAQAKAMSNSMMFMMPLMSAWISFTVPCGVGLYWILSNILMALQSYILYKVYNPAEMAAKMKAETEERRAKERQEKIEAKKLAKSNDNQFSEKALSQKELNSMKLAAARRKMAEKYGEAYNENENK